MNDLELFDGFFGWVVIVTFVVLGSYYALKNEAIWQSFPGEFKKVLFAETAEYRNPRGQLLTAVAGLGVVCVGWALG